MIHSLDGRRTYSMPYSKRTQSLKLAVPLLAALFSLACKTAASQPRATPGDSPAARLAAADRLADAAPTDALLQARAGWLDYLVGSNSDAALRRFTAASESKGANSSSAEGRALALVGLGEIREDRLETVRAVQAFAAAIATAPQAPIAELAAQRLLDIEGDSGAIEDLILQSASSTGSGAAPRTARLLREAAARIADSRSTGTYDPSAWAAMGVVQRYRVAGPFAATRLQDLGTWAPLDSPELTRAPATGPAGNTAERELVFPDGDAGLDLEPPEGDLFYAASQLSCARGGDYLLWVEGAAAMEVRLDGVPMISRSPWPREAPRGQSLAVTLAKGTHALLVRWSRSEGPRFRITLARADGAASDITSEAPDVLSGQRIAPPRPPPLSNRRVCRRLAASCMATPAWDDAHGLRGAAESWLANDDGDPLAAFLLARAALPDDKAAARAALEKALALSGNGAPVLALHAALVLRDPEVPDRLGRARALSDLRDALNKQPGMLRARLTAAALQRDSERTDDAATELAKAVETAKAIAISEDGASTDAAGADAAGADAASTDAAKVRPLPARLLLARSRLLDAQGNPALARAAAESALAQEPSRCDARAAVYDFARREGGLAEQRRLADGLRSCPDQSSLITLLRERGELQSAESLLAQAVEQWPAQPQRLEQLAEVQVARGHFPDAIASMHKAALLAPRSPEPLRRLAGWLDAFGDSKSATAARTAALAKAPGDLALRHQLAFLRGERLLAWSDRDGVAISKQSGELGLPPSSETPSAVRLLDYGGLELTADGALLERTHTVARVLDKKGIARFGEAQIPGDAEVLELRTIKPDGRTLEPESIPEKEGWSLPGLEPGDSIEIDYLRSTAPRGPELPGATAGSFFFRDDETPMSESTYDVRAAPGIPLEVDAHNLTVEPLTKDASGSHFIHTARGVVALQPEPNQPGETEIGPWVQIGWGAGQKELIRSLADWALLRARPGAATDALARAAGGSTVREKAERIVAAVSQAVRGRSNGSDFSVPAPHVLLQGRGNRLLVVKAALASAGVKSHLALVRPFGSPLAPMRFPRGDLFTYAVLRIDPPVTSSAANSPSANANADTLWIDTTWRQAPVGVLPSFARGQAAWILPEPGEEALLIQTPGSATSAVGPDDGRALTLDLTLDQNGLAAGTGRDEQRGFEAAALRDALERLDGDQRRQAIEGMLGRGLHGVSLEKLGVEGENSQGGTASLLYTLRAQVGRREGDALLLPGSVFPARLGKRWVQKAERTQTLLFEALEKSDVRTSLTLPAGVHLQGAPAKVSLTSPFGTFSWEAREETGRLVITESLVMPPQRIAASDYPRFVEFARAVDRAQEQELSLGRKEATAAR